MTTEHTPGPWHCDHSGGRIAVWGLGDQRVYLGALSEKGQGRRVAEANAALIAAAPDLLAMCEEILRDYQQRPDYQGDIPDRLRALIAEARGQKEA